MNWSLILVLFFCELPELYVAHDNGKTAQQISEAVNQFGWNLLQYQEKAAIGKNVLISPISINVALTMAMAGASNGTFDELYTTLGFSKFQLAQEDIYLTYRNLLQNLTSHESLPESQNPQFSFEPSILQLANAFIYSATIPISMQYTTQIANNFNAQTFALDFGHKSEYSSTSQINTWVDKRTNGKIPQIFNQNVPSDTSVILLNSAYLQAHWKIEFYSIESSSRTQMFHLSAGESKAIPFMFNLAVFSYGHFPDGQLVELPFSDSVLSFYLFLPDTYIGLDSTLASFNTQQSFESRISQLQPSYIHLSMPKFKLNVSYNLQSTLNKLGITKAFKRSSANFSRITAAEELFIGEIVHRSTLEVNEGGIEVSSSTAIRYSGLAAMSEYVYVDRAFLFFIRNKKAGVNVFAGVVRDPEE